MKITKYTHCGICLAACGLEVEVEGNRIAALRGDAEHPLTRGFLCSKGTVSHELVDDPPRLRFPYERQGDKWRRTSWNDAYDKIAARLKSIIAKHGPEAVAMYYGAGNPTSSINYMMADGFLRALGSDRMYNVLTLEFTNRYYVMEKMYGKQFFVTQPDLERTQCLLIFGSNPIISLDHPGIVDSLKALKKRGGRLIVVDPRRTETARLADIHAQVIPGTDLFLLLGIYSHIFGSGLQDAELLKRYCTGEEVFGIWKEMTPKVVAPMCGVPELQIIRIAEEFARADSACAVCKLGVNTSAQGTATYWLVEALNVITGNVDRPGGLIFNPGILDLNLLSRMAVGRRERKSKVGGYPYLTGSYPASVLPEEILSDRLDRVRALIVDAGDPSLAFPDARQFEKAAEKLDLLVSIDIYMNESAQLADFVLPAANFFEKDDLYVTFPDHFPYPFAQWSHKVVDPPNEVKAEWEIFRDLSRRLGVPLMNQKALDLMFRAGENIGAISKHRDRFTFNPKNYYKLLLGMMGKVKFGRLMANPHGVKAGDIEFGSVLRKLATPSRRIELAPEEIVQEAQRAVADGASATRPRLLLISGERSPHTKNSNLRGLSSLTARQSENFARINPEDAAALSIQDREIVEIATANGSLRIRARIADDIRAGVVSVGHGWGRALFQPEQGLAVEVKGSNANVLTGTDALDRLTGMPMYNAIACSMRRVDQSVSAKGK